VDRGNWVTLSAFLSLEGFVGLLTWNALVLSAAQLTIRLIMAYSLRTTLRGAFILTLLGFPVAAVYDVITGPQASFSTRLQWAAVPMVLMALAGFAIARWILRFRRTRGQIVAAGMIGLLAPHLFTLAPPLA
jgi:hypothetical protein